MPRSDSYITRSDIIALSQKIIVRSRILGTLNNYSLLKAVNTIDFPI